MPEALRHGGPEHTPAARLESSQMEELVTLAPMDSRPGLLRSAHVEGDGAKGGAAAAGS